MKNTEREQIKTDFLKMIEDSWTYAKLTRLERAKIIDFLLTCKLYGNNKKHIFDQLHAVYYAFILALNYEPIHWREDKNEDAPDF